MHVGANPNYRNYNRVLFSEIYQSVRDNPTDVFDPAYDTNAEEPLVSAVLRWNDVGAVEHKARWFSSVGPMDAPAYVLFSPLDRINDEVRDYYLDPQAGEGRGMWTNGSREGAVYASHGHMAGIGHGSPWVNWGFRGRDGSQMDYGSSNIGVVGTHCREPSLAPDCAPDYRMNYMFVR